MSQPMVRRYSKIEVPLHFVWATFERRPLITPEVERHTHRAIWAQARDCDCTVLAVNGMPDHVHLAVLFSPNLSIADFAARVKGRVSWLIGKRYAEERFFRWENGYGVFAFPYSHRDKVIAYIQGQKEHHASGTARADWEETEVWRDGQLFRARDVEGDGMGDNGGGHDGRHGG